MQITDPQIIEDGEKDLIKAVQEDLDLDAVRQILKDRIKISTLSSKGGQIVVHNNTIAFRMDFDINLSGSLLFDRQGNHIDESVDDTTLKPAMELDVLNTDEPSKEPDSDETDSDETDSDETDSDEIDSDEQYPDEEMSIDLPEYDLEDEQETDPTTKDPTDMTESNNLDINDPKGKDMDDENPLQEEMLDDDINDILKESREFWEQKKQS
ncbi:MAG: hypothetical protein GY710_12495 [Desulfobacteraceae bacterium]|nr:hypothetical protein [Desulfobacteraceae bacterium]